MSTETTTELPTWDEMSDLDKGAALLHAWKRSWEGPSYAVENYPAEYLEDPRLMTLGRKDACKHAARVTKGWQDWDIDETTRLYDAALDASREHGPDWSGWQDGDDGPSCKCGFNGTPDECRSNRIAEASAEASR